MSDFDQKVLEWARMVENRSLDLEVAEARDDDAEIRRASNSTRRFENIAPIEEMIGKFGEYKQELSRLFLDLFRTNAKETKQKIDAAIENHAKQWEKYDTRFSKDWQRQGQALKLMKTFMLSIESFWDNYKKKPNFNTDEDPEVYE